MRKGMHKRALHWPAEAQSATVFVMSFMACSDGRCKPMSTIFATTLWIFSVRWASPWSMATSSCDKYVAKQSHPWLARLPVWLLAFCVPASFCAIASEITKKWSSCQGPADNVVVRRLQSSGVMAELRIRLASALAWFSAIRFQAAPSTRSLCAVRNSWMCFRSSHSAMSGHEPASENTPSWH